VAVAPGATSVPPRELEPEPTQDTILDVELVDDEESHAGAAPPPAAPLQPFMASPGKASSPRPKEASETFMVPQDSLEEAPQADMEDDFSVDASLDSLDDDEGLEVDGTDMSDVSDMLDGLDDD
jgi:hypothetical protein